MGIVRTLPRHSNGSSGPSSSPDSFLGAQALEQRLRTLFDRVAPFTVGAEEELLLIDAETLSRRRQPSTRSRSVPGDRRLTASSAAPDRGDDPRVRVGRRRGTRARLDPPARRGRPRPRLLVVGAGAHALTRDPGPVSSASRYRRIAAGQSVGRAQRPHVRAARPRCGQRRRPRARRLQRAPQLLARAARAGANAPFYAGEDSASPPCARS